MPLLSTELTLNTVAVLLSTVLEGLVVIDLRSLIYLQDGLPRIMLLMFLTLMVLWGTLLSGLRLLIVLPMCSKVMLRLVLMELMLLLHLMLLRHQQEVFQGQHLFQ